jgi:peptidoglycan hydrolase CwlO-like protein
MAAIAELVVSFLFFGLTVFITQELINLGVIQMATFPFAYLSGLIIALTLVINKVTSYIVGVITENKAMKDKEDLRTLLKEELKPLKDKIDSTDKKIDDLNASITTLVGDVAFLKGKEEAKRELTIK